MSEETTAPRVAPQSSVSDRDFEVDEIMRGCQSDSFTSRRDARERIHELLDVCDAAAELQAITKGRTKPWRKLQSALDKLEL